MHIYVNPQPQNKMWYLTSKLADGKTTSKSSLARPSSSRLLFQIFQSPISVRKKVKKGEVDFIEPILQNDESMHQESQNWHRCWRVSRVIRIGYLCLQLHRTNTDGVILDPSRSSESSRGIIAWHKASTTSNPSDGINNVITAMFSRSKIDPSTVASVTIGTTHFINAVVERDASRLAKVAVVRLCGPFSKSVPPCIDWPVELSSLILGYYCRVQGGLEVDGNLIDEIDPDEIREQAKIIKAKGIENIVINGIFSPVDVMYKQEESATEIIRQVYSEADIVMSKDVANLGFLERENAAILNASILSFARKTIASFQSAISRLQLRCSVFITQK